MMFADSYTLCEKTASLLFSLIFSAGKTNYCQFARKMPVIRQSSIPIRPLATLEEAFTRVKMRAVTQKFHSFLIRL